MQQRLELRGHHQVDQEDRQAEREQQRTDRLVQLLALAADVHADAGAERFLGAPSRCTSSTAVPRSMSRRLAETIATRTWSARWISLGPVVATTSATDVQRHRARRFRGLTIRRRMSRPRRGRFPARAPARRSCGRGSCSAWPLRRAPCAPPGRRSGAWSGPARAARSWSKRIWISGKPCSTVDFTSAKCGVACSSIAASLLAGALRCASRSWPRSSISSGVEKLKSCGRPNFDLRRPDAPPSSRACARSRAASASCCRRSPSTTLSLPMFSPLSVGLASRRVPVPLTPYSAAMPSSLACCLLHRAHQRVGFAQRRAGRQLDRHLEAVLRQLRDQVGAQRRHQPAAQREGQPRRSPGPATAAPAPPAARCR